MFDQLTQTKDRLLHSLSLLLDSISLPIDNMWEEFDLKKKVSEDSSQLKEYWDFIIDNYHNSVVALVGIVNAGKSAIGNVLLNQSESGTFAENPIRETSTPSQATLSKNTILIDLPGLGSVLADEDDAIVKSFVKRANLLLIVISVDAPISRHLYEFLQSEVIKESSIQRIVFVLNKIDTWDNLPQRLREKELSQYQDFLVNGDSSLGFSGVKELFEYEIPVIPFSVKHARARAKDQNIDLLKKSVETSLVTTRDGLYGRAQQELQEYFNSYAHVIESYFHLNDVISKGADHAEWVREKLIKIINDELSVFHNNIVQMDNSCWTTMNDLPKPTWFEKLFDTESLSLKKRKLRETREDYSRRMKKSFSDFHNRLVRASENLTSTAFDDPATISGASSGHSRIEEILEGVVYINWDVQDDIFYLDKSVSSDKMNERTRNRLEELGSAIDEWLNNSDLLEAIYASARKTFERRLQQLKLLIPLSSL
jgi:GTPase Era involved in 16S rRNA processing